MPDKDPSPFEKLGPEILETLGPRMFLTDVSNNHRPLKSDLANPEFWPEIQPIQTYEGYLRENKPSEAEAYIAASNKTLVGQYNDVVDQINNVIGGGVTSEEQAIKIRVLVDEAQKIVSGK